MVTRVLYVLAAAVLIAGLGYAIFMDPRPCGMDDVLNACGSGARATPIVGAAVASLLLLYVGRALRNNRTPR